MFLLLSHSIKYRIYYLHFYEFNRAEPIKTVMVELPHSGGLDDVFNIRICRDNNTLLIRKDDNVRYCLYDINLNTCKYFIFPVQLGRLSDCTVYNVDGYFLFINNNSKQLFLYDYIHTHIFYPITSCPSELINQIRNYYFLKLIRVYKNKLYCLIQKDLYIFSISPDEILFEEWFNNVYEIMFEENICLSKERIHDISYPYESLGLISEHPTYKNIIDKNLDIIKEDLYIDEEKNFYIINKNMYTPVDYKDLIKSKYAKVYFNDNHNYKKIEPPKSFLYQLKELFELFTTNKINNEIVKKPTFRLEFRISKFHDKSFIDDFEFIVLNTNHKRELFNLGDAYFYDETIIKLLQIIRTLCLLFIREYPNIFNPLIFSIIIEQLLLEKKITCKNKFDLILFLNNYCMNTVEDEYKNLYKNEIGKKIFIEKIMSFF
jgi:hypothetical protein